MWGSSREINSKSKFDPCCVHLKHHKASNGKNLNISEQEVILFPPPLSSSCSSWLLLTFTMCQELCKVLYKVFCYNTCLRNNSEKVLVHMWFSPTCSHFAVLSEVRFPRNSARERSECTRTTKAAVSRERHKQNRAQGETKNVISAWFHWRLWNVNCTRVALTLKQGSWTLVLQC